MNDLKHLQLADGVITQPAHPNKPPSQVRLAVSLCWAGFFLVLVQIYLGMDRDFPTGLLAHRHGLIVATLIGAFLAFVATINVCIYRGHNWARFTLLALELLGVYLSVVSAEPLGPTTAEKVVELINWSLTPVVLYLLFIPHSVRSWFFHTGTS